MSGIGLPQPNVCEVQLAHDHVQPHQHVQLHHHEVLGRPKVQIQHIRNVLNIRNGRVYDGPSSKHKKPFISAPGLDRAILSVFLDHLA